MKALKIYTVFFILAVLAMSFFVIFSGETHDPLINITPVPGILEHQGENFTDCSSGKDASGKPCEIHWIQFGPLKGWEDRCSEIRSLQDFQLQYGDCHTFNYVGFGCYYDEYNNSYYGESCDQNGLFDYAKKYQ